MPKVPEDKTEQESPKLDAYDLYSLLQEGKNSTRVPNGTKLAYTP